MDDASLDDFVDDGERGGSGDASDGGDDGGGAESGLATYAWSPDGGECAACGDAVERRWRDDGDLVCEECKDW